MTKDPNSIDASNAAGYQTNPSTWETITQPLYSTLNYPPEGCTNLWFFQRAIGVEEPELTPEDTNMELPGQLPKNRMFLIEQVEVRFQTDDLGDDSKFATARFLRDAFNFYRRGHLALYIGSTPYLRNAPLGNFWSFPPIVPNEPPSPLAKIPRLSRHLRKMALGGFNGKPYVLAPNNLLIVPEYNFVVSLEWPNGMVPISAPARVSVILHGKTYRKAN